MIRVILILLVANCLKSQCNIDYTISNMRSSLCGNYVTVDDDFCFDLESSLPYTVLDIDYDDTVLSVGPTSMTNTTATICVDYIGGVGTQGVEKQFIKLRNTNLPTIEVKTFDDAYSRAGVLDACNIEGELKGDYTDKSTIEAYRQDIINHLYDSNSIPDAAPDNIDNDYLTWINSTYATTVNRLRFDLSTPSTTAFQHYVYEMVPNNWNGESVITNHGHGNSYTIANNPILIDKLLQEGYKVYSSEMTASGENISPFGNNNHNLNPLETTHPDHTITIFLDAAIRSVEYAFDTGSTEVHMIGHSGGGWMTELVASIDPRLSTTVSNSGSHPIFVREVDSLGFGDYEQGINGTPSHFFNNIASYLDLYLLASCDRDHYKIDYMDDPCCFPALYQELYCDFINEKVNTYSGDFHCIQYQVGGHKYGLDAIEFIIENL